jgi:hypothetical protein
MRHVRTWIRNVGKWCLAAAGLLRSGKTPMTVPLVRTEGKAFADGPTLSPQIFVELPALERASKTMQARNAEHDFGLGDCLYFFAGHACPDFGGLVLAYAAEMADADDGDATPFDTGGLSLGFVHARDLDKGETRTEYCRKFVVGLGAWRRDAASYIDEYFASPAEYVNGSAPVRDDPSGRLRHPKNDDRRAWTWEVRIRRDHPVEQALRKAWASPDYFEGVRQALRKSTSSAATRCADLLAKGMLVEAPLDEPVHPWAEMEMASWA